MYETRNNQITKHKDTIMSLIGLAKQTSNNRVEVYDENGSYKFSKQGELVGFTSTTISVAVNGLIEVYDENGSYKFSK